MYTLEFRIVISNSFQVVYRSGSVQGTFIQLRLCVPLTILFSFTKCWNQARPSFASPT